MIPFDLARYIGEVFLPDGAKPLVQGRRVGYKRMRADKGGLLRKELTVWQN
jgi:hypothetical protein